MSAPTVERDALVIGDYRYWLTRFWDRNLPSALFVMLNPSTADGLQDDHTIRKCTGFAERIGFGGYTVANLFAYRATDPKVMMAARSAGVDVVGPNNLATLGNLATSPDVATVVAWGASTPKDAALHIHRVTRLLAQHADLHCLGKTKSGAPRHPLMVGYDQPLELFQARAA